MMPRTRAAATLAAGAVMVGSVTEKGMNPKIRSGLAVAVVAAVVAASGGCGADEPASDPPFVSGSRLRAIVLDAGDGAVMLSRFRDTKLNVDCSFSRLTDGSWRCIPAPAWHGFSDGTCTGRVARIKGPPPTHAVNAVFDPASSCADAATAW